MNDPTTVTLGQIQDDNRLLKGVAEGNYRLIMGDWRPTLAPTFYTKEGFEREVEILRHDEPELVAAWVGFEPPRISAHYGAVEVFHVGRYLITAISTYEGNRAASIKEYGSTEQAGDMFEKARWAALLFDEIVE